MNVTEPNVLCLQAPQRLQGILGASPDQGLPAAHPGADYPEVAEEQPEEAGPTMELPIEFLQLLDKRLPELMLAAGANELRLLRIRKHRYHEPVEFNELRLRAKMNGMARLGTREDVQISIQFFPVVACNQDHRCVICPSE
jgi:hypothetical protein